MNIGIDIDGVLTNVGKFILDKGLEYCKETNKGKRVKPVTYHSKEMFGWDEETDLDFWSKNIFLYARYCPPLEGAAYNIKKLKEDGNNIYIITARWIANGELSEYDIKNNKYFKYLENPKKEMQDIVKYWLKKNNIMYDKLLFTRENKEKEILENNIDIMVEDSPKNIESLSKITKIICMSWDYNEHINGENIYRCHSWNETYDKIIEFYK